MVKQWNNWMRESSSVLLGWICRYWMWSEYCTIGKDKNNNWSMIVALICNNIFEFLGNTGKKQHDNDHQLKPAWVSKQDSFPFFSSKWKRTVNNRQKKASKQKVLRCKLRSHEVGGKWKKYTEITVVLPCCRVHGYQICWNWYRDTLG